MSKLNLDFNWNREPEAEKLVWELISNALTQSVELKHLQDELKRGSSTELIAWIDYISAQDTSDRRQKLKNAGFEQFRAEKIGPHFRHPRAKLPTIVLKTIPPYVEIAIHAESLPSFLSVRGWDRAIDGSAFSGFRRALIEEGADLRFWVSERRGVEGLDPIEEGSSALKNYFKAKEVWLTRPRLLQNEEKQLKAAEKAAKKIVKILGPDRAASLILECERDYWEKRNSAGQIQKNRQDRLGMGWANHDHHTFRSSRKNFQRLVLLFEQLGFVCRERFYAGLEAGWGAQVMENERAKLVLFLDVDLSPGEVEIDFAHEPLAKKNQLGTIGLWCALHGDSILKAGMHHLEAQFNFEALSQDLKSLGIGMMEPFSNFPYLKQAFTHGEIWQVDPDRISKLLKARQISPEQADKFQRLGAIGSHMENLQRKEGYKGFNQKNVSTIIKKTDPRLQVPDPSQQSNLSSDEYKDTSN